jgi:phosphoribosylformylglycinamidine synthase PurS subunit
VARVIIDVMLKPEIHDPQGEAVLSASHRLGFGNVRGIRQGKRFELEIPEVTDAVLADIEKLADTFLANTVIENYTVRVEQR